ncbi:HAMP domain-containing sensor histidine kinase [Streptomyces sp. RKAG293]|uniref:sensor histidine kinase n=1 Tax=Streptomyces sp. RKAG293 TaxID=2893403 RepID=UPI00203444E0|nr:HAMP domain-containing sensor histidine kinase [Streptomyces sp. RKAG293]MCM2422634.1 HAMP domain-containing histidine kinase [Streptomyces sp. RKAG293]
MRADPAGPRFPLRRSLMFRLLAATLLIAGCAVTATAWLAVRTTTVAIHQQQGQVLADDTVVYRTLMTYAASHPGWENVEETVRDLGDRTHRRITLTPQGRDRRPLADSDPDTGSLPERAFAVIDPLWVDPALDPSSGTDRIDPQAVGPYRLSETDRRQLAAATARATECLTRFGFGHRSSVSPAGRPRIEVTGPGESLTKKIQDSRSEKLPNGAYMPGAYESCGLAALDTPTSSERNALAGLNTLVGACLERLHLPPVAVGLDFLPPNREGSVAAATQKCVETSRREQLTSSVAPAALLYVSTEANSAIPGFDLSPANTSRIVTVTALVLLLTIGVTVLVGLRLVRPLRALTRAARQPTRPEIRVPVISRDEIGLLTAAFNDLSEHRAHTEEERRVMVSDIAHELRTPLTNIRSTLEAAQDGIIPADERLNTSLLEETLLLQHIIDDLQDLAAADAGTLRLHPEPLHAEDLLHQVAAGHRAHAEAAGIVLEVHAEGSTKLSADPLRLRQAVSNLVSNATRHTCAGDRITLRVRRGEDGLLIEVADTGTGIDPADLPHVFDRFWRAEKSRSRQTGGSGLGLSIVRKLVEAHGGTVSVASTPGSGTVFTLCLPARVNRPHASPSGRS